MTDRQTETLTERERQTERDRERQRQTERERQTDRNTHRETETEAEEVKSREIFIKPQRKLSESLCHSALCQAQVKGPCPGQNNCSESAKTKSGGKSNMYT